MLFRTQKRKTMPHSTLQVMGILNTTDDSFYAASRVNDLQELLRRAERMLEQGASILDIGGCSTRPGCTVADAETEMRRVVPAVEALSRHFPTVEISVDTFRSEVAEKTLEAGATMINDISGGDFDPQMFPLVARHGAGYVLMHTRGLPDQMIHRTEYSDLVAQVYDHLARRVERLRALGVSRIVVDPGFGFAKDVRQNFVLLRHLEVFKRLGCPVLAGMSRKGMVWKTLGISPEEALNGTTVVNTLALCHGADILRVHDVKEAVEAVRLFEAFRGCE